MNPLAGEVINARYEVIEGIASPEGEPLHEAKVRDVTDGRIATLAVLSLEHFRSPATDRIAFLSGVEQASLVRHINLLQIYDHGEVLDSGDPFVVTEYLRGITLRERIRRIAPFSLSVTIEIAVAITDSLKALHAAGLFHGDLRPQNILLSTEGQIKVAGVGYSRSARSSSGSFELSRPYYPTLDPNDPSALSPADDLYAVGVILYEMLTGSVPPASSLSNPPVSVRAVNPGVPPALDGIVAKALAPEAWQRYQSPGDLLTDLTGVRDALKSGRSLNWSPRQEGRPSPTAPRQARAAQRDSVLPAGEPPTVKQFTHARNQMPADRVKQIPSSTTEDDEDDNVMNDQDRGERNSSPWLGIIFTTLLVLSVVAVLGVVWYFGKVFAVPDDIVIPNLIGKTFDDAQQLSLQDHFHLIEGGSDYSTKWPEDQIYQQDPPAGRTVKAGRDVTVLRSLGPRTLTVPDVVGMTVDRATKALQDADLPAGTETDQYDNTAAQGVIVSQSPAPKLSVARDTTINYTVSKGKQPPDIPQNVQADTTSPTSVDITWDPAARADSYNVSRVTDTGSITVGESVKGTKFTDSSVTPNSSYSYVVEAINAGGSSVQSETVPIVTPAEGQSPPVMGDNVQVSPTQPADGATPDDSSPDNGQIAPKMRQFVIKFRVPWHPNQTRRVQFEVQDATGTTLMYDESHAPGDLIQEPITAFGTKITLRIFVDKSLVKQETR